MNEAEKKITYNIANELAKQRTHQAAERTMMAWIRTALTFIGFGMGIFEAIDQQQGNGIFKSSKLVGLLLIILGVAALLLAIKENKTEHEKLMEENFVYNKKSSLGVKVGYVLIAIGVLAGINIIVKLFT